MRDRGGKLCRTKHLVNLNLSKACWQNRKNITASACEARFQRFDLLRFQSFLLSDNEINFPARRHSYLECVVRATHNSNFLAQAVVPPFALLAPRISRGHHFFAVFFRVTHDGLSERGTNCSLRLTRQIYQVYLRSRGISHPVVSRLRQSH